MEYCEHCGEQASHISTTKHFVVWHCAECWERLVSVGLEVRSINHYDTMPDLDTLIDSAIRI